MTPPKKEEISELHEGIADCKKRLDGGNWKFEEINRKLDESRECQAKTLTTLGLMEGQMEELIKTLLVHQKLLYGNPETMGKDGIIMKLQNNSVEIENVEQQIDIKIQNVAKEVESNTKWFLAIFSVIWGAVVFTANKVWK